MTRYLKLYIANLCHKYMRLTQKEIGWCQQVTSATIETDLHVILSFVKLWVAGLGSCIIIT